MWEICRQLLEGIGGTIFVTVGAVVIGLLLGAPLAALRMSSNAALSFVSAAFINVIRGIPSIVWLFIVFYGISTATPVRFEPFTTAILTLGAIATAQFAEIYRGGLLSVRPGQTEAARVLGLDGLQTFTLIQIPQALVAAIPAGATIAIGLIKESAVISIIGEIGRASCRERVL